MSTQAPAPSPAATQTLPYRCPHCNQAVQVDVRPENEILVCPNENCQKPFKIEVPTAQPMAELLLPPGNSSPQDQPLEPTTPTAAPAQPVGEAREETVLTVRLKMLRRYPLRCMAYFVVVAAAVTAAILWSMAGWLLLVGFSILVAGYALVRLTLWWMRMRNSALVVTTKRCIVESGVWQKQSSDMALDDIKEVTVYQPFLLRLFNVGDLTLVAKQADAHKSILVMAVPAPRDVACRIRDLHPH